MACIQWARGLAAAALSAGLVAAFAPAAVAQQKNVVDDWSMVKAPAAPELKDVKVDPQTTALLVMDFNAVTCNDMRPRCLADLPHVKMLLDKAHAAHALVVYTNFGSATKPAYAEAVAPMKDEPMIVGHADKFFGTDLDKILKDHGIKTVIATGTAPNGAVLFTSFGAASRGYKVVVPVDTMPGSDAYAEQASVWNLANDPGLGNMTTLTTSDKISF